MVCSAAEAVDVVIIGAGQAGLSLNHELIPAGSEHVVLGPGRVAQTWLGRWNSFCLVIPILFGHPEDRHSESDYGSEGWGFESLRAR
jgi:cation diffusion facilitator CzcD-associated flavoprotein CzcO